MVAASIEPHHVGGRHDGCTSKDGIKPLSITSEGTCKAGLLLLPLLTYTNTMKKKGINAVTLPSVSLPAHGDEDLSQQNISLVP